MNTSMRKIGWSPEFGIAARHWMQISRYASFQRLYLFVRGGKEAAIPWIEEGFPGKPMELGFLKVEPRTGLLWASTGEEQRQVFQASQLVLRRVGAAIRAVGETGTPASPRVYHEPWAGAGVVIEARSGLPFTSDYDLAAVIPAKELDYTRDVAGFLMGRSRTSHWAEQARAELNREFGSERFRHGPQALYDQKLGHGDSEHIVAFCASGDVYAFKTPESEGEAVQQYKELLVAWLPSIRAALTSSTSKDPWSPRAPTPRGAIPRSFGRASDRAVTYVIRRTPTPRMRRNGSTKR